MNNRFSDSNIAILCGGCSPERDISILSGKNVLKSLLNLGYKAHLSILDHCNQFNTQSVDVFFNALHGGIGENGILANYLSSQSLLFTGASTSSALLAWNKLMFKHFLRSLNIATPRAYPANINPNEVSYPIIFKPLEGGSSIDIHKISNPDALLSIQKQYKKNLHAFFIEHFIDGIEVTHGALAYTETYIALPLLEIYPNADFYDFHTKYTPGETTFKFNHNISHNTAQKCHDIAKKIHQASPCNGAFRLDMIIDEQETPYVLELNTSPGLTHTSDIPAQANEAGISQEKLMEMILNSAR